MTTPSGLSERAAALWRDVHDEFELAPAEVELLTEACRALDRADEAAAVVDRDGLVVSDRFGSPKAHPAIDVERSARAFFAAAVKQLQIHATEASPTRSGAKPGPKPRLRAVRGGA